MSSTSSFTSITSTIEHLKNLEVFEHVVSTYQEVVSTGGGLETGSRFEADFGNSSIIIPCKSDFIIDVELAAKRSLNPTEFNYFERWYKTTVQLATDEPRFLFDMDEEVRSKLGAELIESKIYPLKDYFAPVDTRRACR